MGSLWRKDYEDGGGHSVSGITDRWAISLREKQKKSNKGIETHSVQRIREHGRVKKDVDLP